MAKGQNSEEDKECHLISTSIPGIGIHVFVPMMLVSLALIVRHWEAVREALLSSIPICCFSQDRLRRFDSVFWLFLCNIIIVVLSIKSGLLCVSSSTDQYGDSSSFVKEIETCPKQQNALERTGTEIREAPGKIEWTNSRSVTITLAKQKQPSAQRTHTDINDIRGSEQGRGQDYFDMKESSDINDIRGSEQGRGQDDFDMKESMAQDQALVEYEAKVTVDGSDDELRRRFDDFIAHVRHQIHSAY
jgi:hypothetical protein